MVLLIALSLALPGWSAPPRTASAKTVTEKDAGKVGRGLGLDSAQIRKFYMDGEFDPALAQLEKLVKTGGLRSHADSVFAFKHMGVMYAAKYETRERGKRYFYQLLMIEPGARILDMYASDMIYMIYKNIQEEIEISRSKDPLASVEKPTAATPPMDTAPVPIPKPLTKSEKGKAWIWWTAGLTTAAAGTGLVVWLVTDGGTENTNGGFGR